MLNLICNVRMLFRRRCKMYVTKVIIKVVFCLSWVVNDFGNRTIQFFFYKSRSVAEVFSFEEFKFPYS